MELFFVRHGQSMGNMTGDYSTDQHDRLSPNGWSQAQRLAERLAEGRYDRVYCSPLRRTMETISPYLHRLGRQAELWPHLAEACWQADRDAPPPARKGELAPIVPAGELEELFRLVPPHTCLPPEDETYQEGLARIAAARAELLARHAGRDETILVVGHGHAGGRLMEIMLGLDPTGRFDHANTGLSSLREQPDGTFTLRFANRL